MARPRANLRMFVAAYPPQLLVASWLASLDALNLPAHKRTPADQVHMTLQFIGDVPAKEVDAVAESVERAAAGLEAFELRAAGLVTLPERGPARLIALETDAPATLLELHRRLVTRLAKEARPPHKERFRPHLTLCRFRSPQHRFRINREQAPAAFAVDQIRLMRSELGHEGAQHHEVAAFALRLP